MEDGSPAAEGEEPKKRKVVKRNLSIVTSNTSMDPTINVGTLPESENSTHAADKLVSDTEVYVLSRWYLLDMITGRSHCRIPGVQDRKNASDEHVYGTWSKLDGRYASYVQSAEKEKLLAALSEAEEWLYTEEGEDATKSAYVSRLDALHVLGSPTAQYNEADARPRVISKLRETINTYMSQATSGDERWDHIDQKDKESVVEKVAIVQKWLDDQVARQAERPQNVNPVLTEEEVEKKRQELIYFATPIFSKLKPRPKTDTPTQPPPSSANDTPNGTGTQTPAENGNAEPTEMDVD